MTNCMNIQTKCVKIGSIAEVPADTVSPEDDVIGDEYRDFCFAEDKSGNTWVYSVERESTEQGFVFKDEEVFLKTLHQPCYVSELSDTAYTKHDFLELACGDIDLAKKIFDIIDWQTPESEIDEMLCDGELEICEKCGRLYDRYGNGQNPWDGDVSCPVCGEPSHCDE